MLNSNTRKVGLNFYIFYKILYKHEILTFFPFNPLSFDTNINLVIT